jgi:uroporphyrinogen-III synthase
MNDFSRAILITRPEPQASLTAVSLREAGMNPLIAPAITLKPLPNAPLQVESLNHQTDGVIVTSQFALQVLDSNGLNRDMPLYVTGKVLADLATDYGFSSVIYAENDATSLLALLMQLPDARRQHLSVVHGNHIAVDLTTTLSDAGFRVSRHLLYQSRVARSLPPEVIAALKEKKVEAALFYSAFTAQCFMELIEQAGQQESLRTVTAVCLSPAIAASLMSDPWKGCIASESPATVEMIRCVREMANEIA